MPDRPSSPTRDGYPHFETISTRWMDNDVYGHVNNVVYYSFFDSAVNRYLIEQAALDPAAGAVIGLVVETQCSYFSPLSFPQSVQAGLRVAHVGRSSVRYEIALFAHGEDRAAAAGHFVHVYVDRLTRRPVDRFPEGLVKALQPLKAQAHDR
jgi:acyl-CoA thioester hydrolase